MWLWDPNKLVQSKKIIIYICTEQNFQASTRTSLNILHEQLLNAFLSVSTKCHISIL